MNKASKQLVVINKDTFFVWLLLIKLALPVIGTKIMLHRQRLSISFEHTGRRERRENIETKQKKSSKRHLQYWLFSTSSFSFFFRLTCCQFMLVDV